LVSLFLPSAGEAPGTPEGQRMAGGGPTTSRLLARYARAPTALAAGASIYLEPRSTSEAYVRSQT
jgi:hypothetical protein